jgi:PAS domain S-box-containing protein
MVESEMQFIGPLDLMAAIVHSSEDAIVSKSLDGVITSWNPAAEALFGYTAQEVIGHAMSEMMFPDDYAAEERVMDQLKKGERVAHYDARRIAKDGRLVDLSLTASAIRDGGGNLVGVSKVIRDITDRKKEEMALMEKEESYWLALETGRIGTWSYEPISSAIIVSSEVRRLYRLPGNLRLDLKIMEDRIHPEDVELVREARARAFDPANNGHYEVEHRIITYVGNEVKWTRVRGKAFFDAEGKPAKLFGTFLDVTDERMAKEELELKVAEKTVDLQRANEQLRRSNFDLEQFAYMASHDLQVPLRKIILYADRLRERGGIEEGSATYLDKISLFASRMAALIRGVLDYSRMGRQEELVGEVNLQELFADVLMDYEDVIAAKQALVQHEGLGVVPGISMQLRQLFSNLIGNSLKFSVEKPEIWIRARPLPKEEYPQYAALDASREYVELLFTDNGVGFDERFAEKLFVIFQRLHNEKEFKGTGIGLALCKKIVENHGGHIRGEGKVGKGAVFTVVLPASAA